MATEPIQLDILSTGAEELKYPPQVLLSIPICISIFTHGVYSDGADSPAAAAYALPSWQDVF